MIESVKSASALPSASGPRVCLPVPPSYLVSCCCGLRLGSVPRQGRGCGIFGRGASGVWICCLWLEGALLVERVVVSISTLRLLCPSLLASSSAASSTATPPFCRGG
jgi:hypothetical protein